MVYLLSRIAHVAFGQAVRGQWPFTYSRVKCAANKEPNKEILDHNTKRKVELKLMEFRLAMEVIFCIELI